MGGTSEKGRGAGWAMLAVPLLIANWYAVAAVLGRDCRLLYEGGNITQCAGGLSEEQMTAVSAAIALALLVVELALGVLVRRRGRSG
ncbi:hypothetical protein SAMN05421874_11026 [Nonomuraea maritima]|uniref:Uncharacterized protein n=1 Tax=Nonomuraea maritima TaxID=683260 RepID=A0A1G9DW29_9ACTN|nr:hypothetical protein [Nonomuraea maritima]SDK68040.1 hypothetical protein SAMN05421874_11026 [Nonomuraea maritima]